MKVTEIISKTAKPEIYQKGSSFMWTDEHISKQLLNIHLDPDVDLASRKLSTVTNTANYLDIDLEVDKYDLVVLIYTDLGVLNPEERELLLNLIYRVLRNGGTFIFDVLKDNELEKRISSKTWEAANSGFWSASPYIAFSESFLYETNKVILFQHTIVDSEDNIKSYRFWTHFFSQNDIIQILKPHNFTNINFREDVLPNDDMWSGDNVIFCLCSK